MDDKDLQIKALTEALNSALLQNKQQAELITGLQSTVANLNETINQFRKMIFGARSENTNKPETGPEYEQLQMAWFSVR